ncbi:related to farnesyltranstransferase (al-3) [Melanopsichium pennsylvanicum]|uniref:(2E,6E)-farnesyl diphosphate synthase n=2 Tax=Melanopsichium pennsylvanicum TaxID=63383 RepID=A0AAJ5C2X5_9BASI|nr:related to farnesyltranstransferase (al-3) [Melanopsichium pennsylvanicum 4]SNX82006.1 related to farnesyltranstransferase (al-3) [Melanopsichium pennsylvanicum]
MPNPGPSSSNLSQTPSSTPGNNAQWYDGMLSHLSSQPAWPADKESAILEPYSYLDSNPGKEVRTKLIEAFNVWLQVPLHKLDTICSVVRMLHTASLLMDDVEDNSDLRRGIPVAHKIYGVPQTINTANYVYFLVFSHIFSMNQDTSASFSSCSLSNNTDGTKSAPLLSSTNATQTATVERLVVDELINLHRGQGMDLLWRDSLICPTEEEYVEMVNNKTGGLFRIAVKLMLSQSPLARTTTNTTVDDFPDLIPMVNLIGLLFQILDDFMNLQSSKYAENKGFAEDLTEGKFSFPIIHSIRASVGHDFSATNESRQSQPLKTGATPTSSTMANRQILNVLKQRPSDLATKQYAVSYMRNVTKSFDYTMDVLQRLDTQANKEIQTLENKIGIPNPALKAILDGLRSNWKSDSCLCK